MPQTIVNGADGGRYGAKVNSDGRLYTYAKAASIQYIVSEHEEQAYQIIGRANLASGTVVALHITNNDPTKNMVITYIRHQVVGASGGTTFPNSSNYFSVGFGRQYSSGGSAATAVNVFSGSGNIPIITAYQGNPTLTGTFQEADAWYTKDDGDMNTYNKEGAMIIPPNKTFEVNYVGDQTSGIIFCRTSFIMGS